MLGDDDIAGGYEAASPLTRLLVFDEALRRLGVDTAAALLGVDRADLATAVYDRRAGLPLASRPR
jgi:hypothetical protein